jgi:hypothetical protein
MTKSKVEKKEIRFKNWGDLNRNIFKSLFNENNSDRNILNEELNAFLQIAKENIVVIKEDSTLNF